MSLPLEGIKVLDISQAIAGPLAGQMLGDLGAEVIKVEKPTGDETRAMLPPEWNGESMIYLSNNRNKRSISIDLKTEQGIKIIHSLIEDCDVFIENFRTGTADRLGIGYEELSYINPSLVYLSISGFGRTGPEKNRGGYDIILQAYGGLMGVTGEPGRAPVKVGTSIVDITTGISGVVGILSALYSRKETGKGQYVDCSLLDSQVMMLNYLIPTYFGTGKSPTMQGSSHPSLFPYQAFPTKDQYIVLGIANDGLWEKSCQALGWEDLLVYKYSTNQLRIEHKEELIEIITDRLSERTCEEVCSKLDAVGVPCSPINSIEQVVNTEQFKYREMAKEILHPRIENLKTPSFPIKFSEDTTTVRRHPPLLGEHTDEVLLELGHTQEEIRALREKKVVK
ncbi:CaiB/BaiF CoA transferase family protein [Ornithinibacillus halophilus]|uniref:Formyl-CoA transferase/CoA:oxalate CoA-transferase n=1 Tax=Ornithinibacillus halophilus TaxID=930117 RepID=A0A1M5GL79_9BACI|nr:CoA transferase [Ornithinibacillus halophilus]SHG04291.1 formyl-CoA transferase/CoA:oxalate CoA-transferase [Ornithinibacillus halophilus]